MKALEEIELDSESIAYRGEGNATLVIALKDKGKVLRFQKYPNNQPIAYRNAIKADLQRHQWFARNVLRRLICKEMFDEPLLVMVSQKNMELINDLWNRCRPGYRICKVIPDQDSWALLLNDYCCLPISPSLPTDYAVGPVITVEIKPKQGFPPMINPNICRFSLKQALKLGSFRSREESCYCPLDIFSGCQTRMEVAMKNLIRTPQNNFRVFRDSKLMYSDQNTKNLEAVLSGFLDENFNEDERSEQVLISLIIDSLLLPFGEPTSSMIHAHSNEKQSYCSYHRHFSCDYDCTGNHKLHPECVLATVLRLQMLDTIGSQGALDIFNTLQCLSPDLISRLEGFGESPQDEALFPFESLGSPARLARESEVDFCMRKLLEYLISLIAKDCSIMISMQRIENPCHNGSTVRGNHQFMMPQKTRINKMKKAISRIYPNGCGNNNNHHYHLRNNSSENSSPRIRIIRDKINKSWYAVSIAITDLDFKKSSKIVQVYKREVKMIEAFNNRLAAGIT